MSLSKKIIFPFLVLFLFSLQFCFAQTETFRKEPELYFDLGEGGQKPLDRQTKIELLKLLQSRIEDLEQKQKAPDTLIQGIEEVQSALRSERRWGANWMGVACGAAAACGAWLLMDSVLPSNLPIAGYVRPMILILHSGMWALNMGLFGKGFFQSRTYEDPPKQPIAYLDLRSKSILDAAQDLSAQIRAMAIPLSFWSDRRLKDFTLRYVSFQALEQLLMDAELKPESDLEKALNSSGVKKVLQDDDWAKEMSDAQKIKIRAQAVRRLQSLELATLKVMVQGLEDVNEIQSTLEWSPQDCMGLLRGYLAGLNPGSEASSL